jgi:hypothetical protein
MGGQYGKVLARSQPRHGATLSGSHLAQLKAPVQMEDGSVVPRSTAKAMRWYELRVRLRRAGHSAH